MEAAQRCCNSWYELRCRKLIGLQGKVALEAITYTAGVKATDVAAFVQFHGPDPATLTCSERMGRNSSMRPLAKVASSWHTGKVGRKQRSLGQGHSSTN